MAMRKLLRRDVLPFLVTLAQLGLNLWIAATWSERTLLKLLLLWPPALFLFWYNPVVATHNFLHTPWFAAARANRAYAALDSMSLEVRQALYRYHRLNQERHLRPQWHWTRRPELRVRLPQAGRLVSKVPPLIGFLDRR